MKIIKRNGAETDFDLRKIVSAITRANAAVGEEYQMTELQIRRIADAVNLRCEELGRTPSVEEIQDLAWEYYFTFPLYESAVHFGVSDGIGDFACAIDASNGYLHLDQFTVDQVTVD